MKESRHALVYINPRRTLVLSPGARADEFYIMAECPSVSRARDVIRGLNKVDVFEDGAVPE